MTTNATTAEDRLAKLGLHLPGAPTPFGAYVPAVQTGNLLFLSGMLATSGHTATVVGIVGKDLDVIAALEEDLGRPLLTGNQVAFWYALRLAGVGAQVDDYGQVFRTKPNSK